MNQISYPVQARWIIKNIVRMAPSLVIMGLISIVLFPNFRFIALFPITVTALFNSLNFSNFSYSLDEKFLTVRQGILNKQERHLPYGAIQDITVQKDIIDRVLGLTCVSIHNASQSGTAVDKYGNVTQSGFRMTFIGGRRRRSQTEIVGFRGNLVHIPGLLPSDAEALRQALLKKMKEHGAEETGSGL